MNQQFPWEGRKPVYVAVQLKQRKQWVIVYAWFCVAMLVAGAIWSKYHALCTIFAFILACAIILKKTDAVTDRGLESFTDMKFTSSNDIWPWDEIEALTWETNPDVPDKTLLYFTRGVRTRKAFFNNEDAAKIKIYVKKNYKDIKIYDGTQYRAEARAFNESQRRSKKKKKK